jgi:hypothetical protein
VDDGAAAPVSDTGTITITPVNDAPTLTLPDHSPVFTEDVGPDDGAAVAINPGLIIFDPDRNDPASATVTITNAKDGDSLVFSDSTGNFIVTWNADHTALTLTAAPGKTPTEADFQTALRSVAFNNGSDNPDVTDRVVRFTVTDPDGLTSVPADEIVKVAASNDPPTSVSISGDTIPENAGPGSSIGVLSGTDPDNGDVLTYSLVPGAGDNAFFTIDGGVLKANGSFDYEGRSEYEVVVRVMDPDGLYSDHTMRIHITDVYEPPAPTPGQDTDMTDDNAVAGRRLERTTGLDDIPDASLMGVLTPGSGGLLSMFGQVESGEVNGGLFQGPGAGRPDRLSGAPSGKSTGTGMELIEAHAWNEIFGGGGGEGGSVQIDANIGHDLMSSPGMVQSPVGLFSFTESLGDGSVLVFNMDEINAVDLVSPLVASPSFRPETFTGLAGYYEGVKAGKALVFNLDEMSFMDLLDEEA